MNPTVIAQVEKLRAEVERRNYQLSTKMVSQYTLFFEQLFRSNHNPSLLDGGGAVAFVDGSPFLNGFDRVVIGAHGPYVEFSAHHMLLQLETPDDQKWRYDDKYNTKYYHKAPVGRTEKVYEQTGPVKYADYKPGKFYIDFYLTSLCEGGVDGGSGQHSGR